MNKAAIASLLAVSAVVSAPGSLPGFGFARAQAAAPAGQITITDPAEFAAYDDAMNKQTTPAAQEPALEAFLAKYPSTVVKAAVVQRLMIDYSQTDAAAPHTKAIASADAELALNPNDLQAYVIEVAYRSDAATAITDPAARQSALDAAADYAQKGLNAAKPAGMADADYAKLKGFATPKFYGAIGAADLGKKDGPGAIAAYKSELAAMSPADRAAPAGLQETYYLGSSYYASTPPDYINCTFYTTRAAALAPAQFKGQLQPLADYCYKKQHGNKEGYDAVVAAATANENPPAGFTIAPAPTDKDQADAVMATTKDEDIPKLATGDKEYVLQYASPANAAKVWDAVKGKSVEIPGALVIESSPTVVKVAVSDDAVQSKKADFTFNIKPLEEPKAGATPAAKKAKADYDKEVADIAAATAVGQKVTLTGTYDSYTPSPLMITMNDGAVVLAKKAAPAPARRPAPAHHK